jgi:hypothetical protein
MLRHEASNSTITDALNARKHTAIPLLLLSPTITTAPKYKLLVTTPTTDRITIQKGMAQKKGTLLTFPSWFIVG